MTAFGGFFVRKPRQEGYLPGTRLDPAHRHDSERQGPAWLHSFRRASSRSAAWPSASPESLRTRRPFRIATGRAQAGDDATEDRWLDPDAIAAEYLHVHRQHLSAWAWEVELRPWVEKL